MREFAKTFYESPAWRRTRAYILKRDAGLCVHCGEPGVIRAAREEYPHIPAGNLSAARGGGLYPPDGDSGLR